MQSKVKIKEYIHKMKFQITLSSKYKLKYTQGLNFNLN